MNRWLFRSVLVLCSAVGAWAALSLVAGGGEPTVAAVRGVPSKPALNRPKPTPNPALWPARQAAAKRLKTLKQRDPSARIAALQDDADLLDVINASMTARGSGIAPEITAAMSLPDARLAQWLMLQFSREDLRAAAGPGAAARRQLNRLVLRAVGGVEAP